jgi:hypothetical protein
MTTFVETGFDWKQPVAAATTADLGATFVSAGNSGADDTITASSNAALTVDAYTPVLFDRILVKDQTVGTQNGIYGVTQLNTAGIIDTLDVSGVSTLGITTQPTGTLTDGTYDNVSLTDDSSSGTGVVVDVTVAGGVVTTVSVVNAGTGYVVNDTLYIPSASITGATANGVVTVTAVTQVVATGGSLRNGTYFAVPLSGGAGTGASATIIVAAGVVNTVGISAMGSGYLHDAITSVTVSTAPAGTLSDGTYADVTLTNDVSATGFGTVKATIVVASGAVSTVTITSGGADYAVSDTLYIPNGSIPGQTAAGVVAVSVISTDVLHFNANGDGYGNGEVTVGSVNSLGWVESFSAFIQPTSGFSVNGQYSNVALTGGTGTGATANVYVSDGVIQPITMLNTGTGYVAGDVLTLSNTGINVGIGSGATVQVVSVKYNPWVMQRTSDASTVAQLAIATVPVKNGTTNANTTWKQTTSNLALSSAAVSQLEVVDEPVGTLTAGTYSSVALSGGNGTGLTANVTVASNGVISNIVVVDGGSDYVDHDVVTIPYASITGATADGYAVVTNLSETISTALVFTKQ